MKQLKWSIAQGKQQHPKQTGLKSERNKIILHPSEFEISDFEKVEYNKNHLSNKT